MNMCIPKISYTGEKRSHSGCSLTLEGLTGDEADLLKGLLQGRLWATVEDGRLQKRWNLADLPEQTPDDEMLPFWRMATAEELSKEIQYELREHLDMPSGPFVSFVISHLCGYSYFKANYVVQATRLSGYGFVEMRSRRDHAGRFTEQWVLAGEHSAKGLLKEHINDPAYSDLSPQAKIDRIVSFLCKNCSFGTLDLSRQYVAMTVD